MKVVTYMYDQGRNLGENLGSTSAMGGRICPPPPGWDRVKVAAKTWCVLVHMPTGPPDYRFD